MLHLSCEICWKNNNHLSRLGPKRSRPQYEPGQRRLEALCLSADEWRARAWRAARGFLAPRLATKLAVSSIGSVSEGLDSGQGTSGPEPTFEKGLCRCDSEWRWSSRAAVATISVCCSRPSGRKSAWCGLYHSSSCSGASCFLPSRLCALDGWLLSTFPTTHHLEGSILLSSFQGERKLQRSQQLQSHSYCICCPETLSSHCSAWLRNFCPSKLAEWIQPHPNFRNVPWWPGGCYRHGIKDSTTMVINLVKL